MLIHAGGPDGVSGVVELYPRPERQNWIAGPHLVGEAGQLMVKSNPQTGHFEVWHCPTDVSFASYTPPWRQIEIPDAALTIEGKTWPGQPSIWSVRDMVQAISAGRQPELGGAGAAQSLECVSAVYESHFTGARATLPLADRRHPLIRRLPAG